MKAAADRLVLAFLLAMVATACSSGSDDELDPTDPGSNNNSEFFFRANVDGAWAADSWFASSGGPGIFLLSGGKTAGTNPYLVAFTLYNIGGAGTYPLGVGYTVAGGSASVSGPQGSWTSPLTGSDGSITITQLTTARIAGTFNFTVEPLSGGATGTKTATSGEFVLPLTGVTSVGPLPDNFGSKATATVAGANWNASNASGAYSAANRTAQLFVGNNTRQFSISLNELTGPGTYALAAPARVITATQTVSSSQTNIWTTSAAGGSGSVTITSLTATRIRGTFTAALVPNPGSTTTGNLSITNGTFDIGLPSP